MFDDYHDWIQLQTTAGGLPANVIGYLGMRLVRLTAHTDLHSPNLILQKVTPSKYLSPDSLPQRTSRPQMHKWPVPQRQSSAHPSEVEFTLLKTRMEAFITVQKGEGVEISKGVSYDSLDAYYLGKHELWHIHPVDKSFHVHLHPADAKVVVERGWGEWFGLTGKMGQAWGVVFVYAARTEEDIEGIEKIWEASVEFAKAGGKV
jgi:hypothetical protein